MEAADNINRKRKLASPEPELENSAKKPLVSEESEDDVKADIKLEDAQAIETPTEVREDNEPNASTEAPAEEAKTEDVAEEKPTIDNEETTPATLEKSDNSKQPFTSVVPFDRLIILHLEATCDENPTNPAAVQVTKENSEVIELSFVVVNAHTMEVLHKQQIFVKPERTPLTSFCSEITGIKSSMLEEAGSLSDAINKLDEYIQREIIGTDGQNDSLDTEGNGTSATGENKGSSGGSSGGRKSFCFVTHGGWALRIQLPREARDKGLALPNYLAYCRMFDLKQEIQRWQVHHPEFSFKSTSVRDLCELFGLERVKDHTVGLNHALTNVEIMRYLLKFRHEDVFVYPIDTEADLKQFKKEESKVIHLAGLPFEVTQGELEAWFSSNGLRPMTMWMLQLTDNAKPSISGFVVFAHHQDAMRALVLNGRCLGDRPIEVCPSSARVIEKAGNMLVAFPVQAKTRQLRPGDWMCFNCNFHNFASRLYCFKCNTENPNPGPTAGHVPYSQPFTPGDWMCPQCNYHNYSSRIHCKKCSGPRPPQVPPVNRHKKLINTPGGGTKRYPPAPHQQAPPPGQSLTASGPYQSAPPPHHQPSPYQQQPPSYQPSSSYQPSTSYQQPPGYGAPGGVPPHHQSSPYQQQSPSYQPSSSYQPSTGYQPSGYGAPSGAPPSAGPSGYHGGYGAGGSHHHITFRPGDWYCPNANCGFQNFASRSVCFRCHTPNPNQQQQPPHHQSHHFPGQGQHQPYTPM
ncbi:hypothetical protein BDF20DRAFT_846228 [Mycotypha africana]|uniref:uncharacterized protein n=1 Tax=Mycotypha africana TaxID=64632 RepID=UPI002301F582|nr:uncharacterized protein BDF20DRAFT_846228 [Mycotypha africana]KAI8991753.1 hypothetical protein BDF20DRAFT_846228 [Mycotypha africana]